MQQLGSSRIAEKVNGISGFISGGGQSVIGMAETSRMRVNILCLFGVLLGVVALFVQWFSAIFGHGGGPMDTSPFAQFMPPFWMSFFSVAIFGGTILGLVSPLAGLLDITGIVVYVYFFTTHPAIPPGATIIPEHGLVPGFGPIIAIWSSVVMLASIVWPMGHGYMGAISITDRLFTINPARQVGGRLTRGLDSKLSADFLDMAGVVLVFGGAATSVYSSKEAEMMRGIVRANAEETYGLLNSLNVIGIIASVFGAVILVISIAHSYWPVRRSET